MIEEVTPMQYRVYHTNQVKVLADTERTASKPCTFSLQFFGTPKTMMNNLGYSKEKAERIHKAFRDTYPNYFKTVDDIIAQAGTDGYITVAFGLRIDAPALRASVLGIKATPSIVDAEFRSLGNAICQSYGALNERAARAFQQAIWDSEYKYTIFIQNLIHDCIYIIAPQTIEAIHWVNRELIKAMTWNELPEIQHAGVNIGAELDVHYDSWATAITLPNNASKEDIKTLLKGHL